MTNSIKLSNIILMIMIALGCLVHILIGYTLARVVTTVLVIFLGAINFVFAFRETAKNRKFSIILLAGLALMCLGDILSNCNLIVGVVLFLLAYIVLFVAFVMLEKFVWKDLIFVGILFIISAFIISFAPVLKLNTATKFVCLIYALIASTVLGKLISNLIKNKNVLYIVLLIGCALLYISNFMLMFSLFGNSYVCYALSVIFFCLFGILMAISILFAKDKQQKNAHINALLNNIKQSKDVQGN